MDGKIKLDVERLEIDSFTTEPVGDDPAAALLYPRQRLTDPTANTGCYYCPPATLDCI